MTRNTAPGHAAEEPLERDDIPPACDRDAPRPRARIDPNDPRPEIVLSTDQPAIADAAERALARRGGVYVRWDPEFIRARTELGRAIDDREVARELLAELDASRAGVLPDQRDR